MTVNGEITNPPEIDAGLAAAALAVFGHRHEVVHLLYAAIDEPDALQRIANLLHVDEATITRVLDQPLRWMLPQFRSELETIAATAPPGLPARATDAATPRDGSADSVAHQEARMPTQALGPEAAAADLEHTSAAISAGSSAAPN